MTSTCWGAGRRTDRLSDGIKPLQLRERPLAAVPLLPFYRKTRAEGTISSGGGATLGCMNDLVVNQRTADIARSSRLDFLHLLDDCLQCGRRIIAKEPQHYQRLQILPLNPRESGPILHD